MAEQINVILDLSHYANSDGRQLDNTSIHFSLPLPVSLDFQVLLQLNVFGPWQNFLFFETLVHCLHYQCLQTSPEHKLVAFHIELQALVPT